MTASTSSSLLDVALAYLQAGRSVVPIAPGCKAPSVVKPTTGEVVEIMWKRYQAQRPTQAQIRAWFPPGQLMGVGIVCGPVSGVVLGGVQYALEVLDVDDEMVLEQFVEAAHWQGLGDLLAWLLHQRTPGGAGHLAYFCVEVAGNTVLARRPGDTAAGEPQVVTLIETRGVGGQVVVAPTPPGIHPEHPELGYQLARGSWEDLPVVTSEERQALWDLARCFNRYLDPAQVHTPRGTGQPHTGGDRPGDRLNATATRDWWRTLLEGHGWTLLRQRGDVEDWQRPGKEGQGGSATLGACGPCFYVFSSSVAPFEPNHGYSPFGAFGILEHDGDFQAAARALATQQDAHQRSNGTAPVPPQTPPEAGQARPGLKVINACDLLKEDIPPQAWIVPEILPAGATLFVGRGKDGKSLLAWNLCIAIATGGTALGRYPVEQGDVLYLALEDGERRAQKRLIEQTVDLEGTDALAHLDLVLWDAPRLGQGLEDDLTGWLDTHPAARLIVVDILEKVRPTRQRGGSVYADDYAAITPLQRLAQERNIAVLIVHHSNKLRPDDFRDTASGSMGLIGACDSFWSIKRVAGAPDAALNIIGRDVDTQELALQFAGGFWTVLGDAEEYRLSQASKDILEVLHAAAGKARRSKELAQALGVPEATVRKRLERMQERGEVLNLGDGRYIPRITPPPSPPPGGGKEGVTGVTGVTPVTGVTGVTQKVLEQGSDTQGQGCDTPPLEGVTPVTYEKDSVLGDLCDSVTGVTPTYNGVAQPPLAPQAGDTCPVCRGTDWLELVTYRKCAACGFRDGPAPQEILRQSDPPRV